MKLNLFPVLFQTPSESWSKTEISYTTEKPSRLPIIDVALQGIDDATHEFAIEVGSVCFQTQQFSN